MPCPLADLVQRHVAIIHRDRLDPVRPVRGQIALVDQAAGLTRMRGDRRGQLAIEVLALAFGDARQRARLSRDR